MRIIVLKVNMPLDNIFSHEIECLNNSLNNLFLDLESRFTFEKQLKIYDLLFERESLYEKSEKYSNINLFVWRT